MPHTDNITNRHNHSKNRKNYRVQHESFSIHNNLLRRIYAQILRLTSQSVKPLVGIYPSAVTKHIAPHFHFMHTVKAAAPNRPRLEGLVCINSKKWDKGVLSVSGLTRRRFYD